MPDLSRAALTVLYPPTPGSQLVIVAKCFLSSVVSASVKLLFVLLSAFFLCYGIFYGVVRWELSFFRGVYCGSGCCMPRKSKFVEGGRLFENEEGTNEVINLILALTLTIDLLDNYKRDGRHLAFNANNATKACCSCNNMLTRCVAGGAGMGIATISANNSGTGLRSMRSKSFRLKFIRSSMVTCT